MIPPDLRRAFDVAISLTGYRHVSVLLGEAIEQAIEIPATRSLSPQPFYISLSDFGRDIGQTRTDKRRDDRVVGASEALIRSFEWLVAARIFRPYDEGRFPGFYHLEADYHLWIKPLPVVEGKGHRTPLPLLSIDQIDFIKSSLRPRLNWKTPSHIDVPMPLQEAWGDIKTPCMISEDLEQWEEEEGCIRAAQNQAAHDPRRSELSGAPERRSEVSGAPLRSKRRAAQKWAPGAQNQAARRSEVSVKTEITPLAPPPLHSPPIIPPGGELTSKFVSSSATGYFQATSSSQSNKTLPPTPLVRSAEDSQSSELTPSSVFQENYEDSQEYPNSQVEGVSRSAEDYQEAKNSQDFPSSQRGFSGAVPAEELLGAENSRDATPSREIRGEGRNSDAAMKLAVWASDSCGGNWGPWAKAQADAYPVAWIKAALERNVLGAEHPRAQNWLGAALAAWKREGRCNLLPTVADAATRRINDSGGGLDGGAKSPPRYYIDSRGKKRPILANLAKQANDSDDEF